MIVDTAAEAASADQPSTGGVATSPSAVSDLIAVDAAIRDLKALRRGHPCLGDPAAELAWATIASTIHTLERYWLPKPPISP